MKNGAGHKADSSGTTTYNWDYENRLTSVVLPGSGGTVSFKYDPFGRRVQKASSSAITNYVYDGAGIVEEVDGAGLAGNRYSQGSGIDEPLAMTSAGSTDYYQADGLRSITGLTDGSGTTVQTYSYDAYGNVVNSAGGIANPYQYTGREWDSEASLYYYRARYFDPRIGRFTSEDPVQFGGGIDFYDYVGNRVADFVDPSGLSGSRPGGPYHPPNGVHTKCLPTDDCSTLGGKMWILWRMIRSHTGWDMAMPKPRGAGRHAAEIAQLWAQYAECYDLYLSKCQGKCERPRMQPATEPPFAPKLKAEDARGVARGVILYWIISEGSRLLFPPRNLVPAP